MWLRSLARGHLMWWMTVCVMQPKIFPISPSVTETWKSELTLDFSAKSQLDPSSKCWVCPRTHTHTHTHTMCLLVKQKTSTTVTTVFVGLACRQLWQMCSQRCRLSPLTAAGPAPKIGPAGSKDKLKETTNRMARATRNLFLRPWLRSGWSGTVGDSQP